MTSRRSFLQNNSLLALGAFLPGETFMNTVLRDVGINLFSLPKMLEQDLEGSFAMLQQLGYKKIEFFGPYSFSTEAAKAKWAVTSKAVGFSGSGFFGKDINSIKQLLQKHGMTAPSLHTDLDTLRSNMAGLAEAAHTLGSKYVVLPAIPDAERQYLDGYKRMADDFNRIGADAKSKGIRFAYHNHGYGLSPMEGQLPLDIIFNQTDPSLVFFEMDLYWTTAGGADPIALLKQHKDRYKLMHVKDMKQKVRFSGDGGNAKQWIELWDYMTTAGDGILDLPNIIKTAKANGVEHFIVEQDTVKSPEIALKRSIDYLKGL
jgi:sugar phosphate isomerase/epimerase